MTHTEFATDAFACIPLTVWLGPTLVRQQGNNPNEFPHRDIINNFHSILTILNYK